MVVGSNWGRYFYQKWCFLQSFDLKELEKTSTIKVIGSGVQVLPPTYQTRVQSIYCADDSHSVRNQYWNFVIIQNWLSDAKDIILEFFYSLNILATWQSYNNFHWFYSCCGGRFILGRNIIWIMGRNTSGKEKIATKGSVSN